MGTEGERGFMGRDIELRLTGKLENEMEGNQVDIAMELMLYFLL